VEQTALDRTLGSALVTVRVAAGLLFLVWLVPALYTVAAGSREGFVAVERPEVLGCAAAALIAGAAWLGALWYGVQLRKRVRLPAGVVLAVVVLALYGNALLADAAASHPRNQRGLPGMGRVELQPWFNAGERPPRRAGVPSVALVGCSMIYGLNLPEAAAPDRALRDAMAARYGRALDVLNYGRLPITLSQFVDVARKAAQQTAPDLLVVYFPAHHVETSDWEGDVADLHAGWMGRLYAASHFVPVVQAWRLSRKLPEDEQRELSQADAFLAGLAALARERRVLLVLDASDKAHVGKTAEDHREMVERAVAVVRATNPALDVVDVSDDDLWQGAETQPDGHWTAQGARTVMWRLAEEVERRVAPVTP
jgi:hypothetical protein